MNRQQRRSAKMTNDERVYTFKESELQSYIAMYAKDIMKETKQEAMDEAINTAMSLLLILPMKVLMDHYWKKSYSKRIPEFTKHLLDYYERWQNGEMDMEKMQEELWEYGGVRLEVSE